MTFRAFSIGFSVAVLALACGGDSGGGDGDDTPVNPANEPAPQDAERETCEDNRLLAGCEDELPPVDVNNNPIAPAPEPEEIDDPAELARAAAVNILASNCGGCHGPALDEEDAEAGMNYINDLDRLADEGQLVPGDSLNSRIIQRMRDASMPPAYAGRDPVSEQEIDIVADFIDNEDFWDVEVGNGSCPDQEFTFDDLYAAVADDLASLDAEDALTARYIALTNRFTAGVCADTTMDRDRQAIFKMVNMLSTDPTISQPLPINDEETIFRVDLADYGWDVAVDVVIDGNVVNFADKWEAMALNNPYVTEFFGDDADDAKIDAATAFPVMLSDSMLDTAIIGNLYYALIDVNVQDTLDNFILNVLDIDVAANLADEEQVRAGTTRSRISRQDRVVQRDEIEIRPGVLYQSFDFVDDANQSIFVDVFDFIEGGTEAIFTLNNGLFGYIIADENSLIVEDSDILLDTQQNNFRAITSVSCTSCHSQGLLPVVDEVREIALENARNSGLNRDEIEQIEAIYPGPSEFSQIIDTDSQRFYQQALSIAGVELQGVEPVSSVFFRFDKDMFLADAAGDLGITPEELDENLDLLNPELAVLENSTMDRDDFTAKYLDSLCRLLVVAENQPDAQLCLDIDANGGNVP